MLHAHTSLVAFLPRPRFSPPFAHFFPLKYIFLPSVLIKNPGYNPAKSIRTQIYGLPFLQSLAEFSGKHVVKNTGHQKTCMIQTCMATEHNTLLYHHWLITVRLLSHTLYDAIHSSLIRLLCLIPVNMILMFRLRASPFPGSLLSTTFNSHKVYPKRLLLHLPPLKSM